MTRGPARAQDRRVARCILERFGALVLSSVIAAAGCGDDGDNACPGSDCPPAGGDTTGSTSPATSEGTTSGEPATDDAPGTTASSDSNMPGDASGDDGGGGSIACDPPNAMFTDAEPPAIERASIQLDPAAMTCAASGTTGEAPQIVFEVRQTGMVDAITYGIEVVDSTLGVVFTDPSEGDSQVTQLPPDIPLTITGTLVDGGTPIEIDFEISPTGPTLIDVAIQLGG